jgi:hypothetical protein
LNGLFPFLAGLTQMHMQINTPRHNPPTGSADSAHISHGFKGSWPLNGLNDSITNQKIELTITIRRRIYQMAPLNHYWLRTINLI